MKRLSWPALGLALACLYGGREAEAQVYSQNVVGYYNQAIFAGNNFIANQLSSGGNTLNEIFTAPVPEGSTFTEWDASAGRFLPPSVYDTTDGWSINYTLTYGQGGLLDATAAFSNTYVGTVWPGWSFQGPYVPPLVADSGVFLLSCYLPIGSATFYDVVGRDPLDGEYVETLNPLPRSPPLRPTWVAFGIMAPRHWISVRRPFLAWEPVSAIYRSLCRSPACSS